METEPPVEVIKVEPQDLGLFLDVVENGLVCTCLPRKTKNKFKRLLSEWREWEQIYDLAE